MESLLHQQAAAQTKQRPDVRPGYTVRVHERIQEGNKERVQVFEGLVIAVHKGATPTDSTLTVRRIASGVGVEKVFLLHSPKIEKIEVKKVAKVRRSKLFFLRGRRGKSARLSERFTTADEFAVAAPPPPVEEVEVPGESEVSTEEGEEDQSSDEKKEESEEVTKDKKEVTEEKAEKKEEGEAEEEKKEA